MICYRGLADVRPGHFDANLALRFVCSTLFVPQSLNLAYYIKMCKCRLPLKEWRRIRQLHPKSESHRRRHGELENHKSGPLDSLEDGSKGLEAPGRGCQLVLIKMINLTPLNSQRLYTNCKD